MSEIPQESKSFFLYIKMDSYFKSEWTDLTPFRYHKLFAFVVNDKGNYPSVSALVETNGIKYICRIKGFLKYKLIEPNENRKMYLRYHMKLGAVIKWM